jgi:16S rRNA (guanine(966)-N(2))-methyltransferase RsmD
MDKIMRIIAGKHRSRIIKMPKQPKIRPTKDRVREALFSIIGEFVVGANVLDLFAGSGAFGIEALSRGAKRAVFIDCEENCVRTIKENLRNLNIINISLVIKMDGFKALDFLENRNETFNLVLLDPPYYKEMAKKSLIKLERRDILKFPCIVIAEHHKEDTLPKDFDNISSYRTVCYGDVCLSFYKAK